jgi:hypothetical protein
MRYSIPEEAKPQIIELYLQGNSSHEIKELLQLDQTPRSIQRYIKSKGVSRTIKEAFNIAVKKGRVTYHIKPNKTNRLRLPQLVRFQVLQRDGFKCVYCGATATDNLLHIDHIDNDKNNNTIDNLQVLCIDCNQGKYQSTTTS